jgi:hypothetical protein
MSEQHNGGVTRRQALGLAAAAAAALEGGLPASPAAARGDGVPRERSFDEGWLFLRGDADGAQEPSYDDSAWRPLDLPHDWSIEDLPYATSADGAATSDPSLLVIKDPDPDRPGGPQVIGPFDPARSENGGSTGYTVGGIGWYRKHFAAPAGHAELRSWSYVDVGDVHYNANGKTYGPMHAAHPERAMTQSEGFPATIHQDTEFVAEHTWAVGNWVWAAWDYLGESGIGKTPMAPEGTAASIGDQSVLPGWSRARTLRHSWGGFGYPYPYVQGNCGDLDLIGQRKPQNHWRAALTGRSPVELLVERPVLPGTEQVAVWWGYFDELADWTWDVDPGHPMTVHV